jgi:F-type H+-transporting ATPase subunit delta
VKVGAQAAARRIARALVDVADAKGDAAAVQGGLRQAAAALRDLPELRVALSNPALSVERRQRVVGAVFKGAPDLLRRLLDLLLAHDAVGLLPQVEQSYTHQWNERRGAVTAQALTAVPLDPALVRRLEQAIHETTGRTAELRAEIDPAILGGVLLRMGGRTYDGTVRGRLRALRQTLKGQTGS